MRFPSCKVLKLISWTHLVLSHKLSPVRQEDVKRFFVCSRFRSIGCFPSKVRTGPDAAKQESTWPLEMRKNDQPWRKAGYGTGNLDMRGLRKTHALTALIQFNSVFLPEIAKKSLNQIVHAQIPLKESNFFSAAFLPRIAWRVFSFVTLPGA